MFLVSNNARVVLISYHLFMYVMARWSLSQANENLTAVEPVLSYHHVCRAKSVTCH